MRLPAYVNAGKPRAISAAMLLYYITDRKQFPGTRAEQRRSLMLTIERAARAGIDYVQLRERDLCGRELLAIAKEAVETVRNANSATRLLVNSRVDVALAAGADGVHLRSEDPIASEARAMAGGRTGFLVAASCHSAAEVRMAWSHGADFAAFGPVFEKNGAPGVSLEALRQACRAVPGFVLALGGVTSESAGVCRTAGASGIAAIRLFQQADDLERLVAKLRR